MRNQVSARRRWDFRIVETVVARAPESAEHGAASATARARESRQGSLPLPVGSRWARLTLDGLAACGSFGTVYRAFDPRTRIQVALKLANASVPDARLNLRLLEEAARLSRVQHPSVVKIYGVAERRGRVGLCMEFLDGRTLDRVLRDEGLLGAIELVRIGHELCQALDAIHEAGLVHGDIKPQNVIRLGTGRVVVIDFGSASEASRPARSGTPLYLAPEVLDGGTPSAASDLYSLGVLLFHLASGDYPVRGDSIEALTRARRFVRPLRAVRPDLPDDLCQVIDRALRGNPRTRFRSAIVMQRALARVLSGSLERVAGAA